MIEILAKDLDEAIKDLGIVAKLTHNGHYQVWEMEESEYKKLCDVSDKDWKDNWGWWRYAVGTNLLGESTHQFAINNQSILAWYNQDKFDDYIETFLEPAYIEEFESESAAREGLIRDYWDKECKYKDFYQYCSEEWGASSERNVCAIAVGLAKLNNLTLGELLNKVG